LGFQRRLREARGWSLLPSAIPVPFRRVLFNYDSKILQDGKATINDGPDGLQQLDKVVASAEKFGIKLIFTLTNNWNPERPLPPTAIGRRNNDGSPRGLSFDDYGMGYPLLLLVVIDYPFTGGMDAYVRAFQPNGTHDLFYTDPTIIQAFKNYISSVVPHFADSPTILAWELANDPRCSSTLPASSSCNPQTITKWVADIGSYYIR
jgi:mannan endo-1,4-beta-mannosidase